MQVFIIALSVRLGNLRIHRNHEVGHKTLHDAVHLISYASCSIERHTKEKIYQDIHTLGVKSPRSISKEAPPSKPGHLLKQ